MNQRERRAKHRAAGRCSCGRPRMIGHGACEACRESSINRREQRASRGICKNCARPSRKDKKTCAVCGFWEGVRNRARRVPVLPMPDAPAAPDGAVGSQPWGVLPAKPPAKNRTPTEK